MQIPLGAAALGVADPQLDGFGGGIGEGDAVELVLEGLLVEGVGQPVGSGGGGLIQGGVARHGVGKAHRGQHGGGAPLLGDLKILGEVDGLSFGFGGGLGGSTLGGGGIGGGGATLGERYVPRTGNRADGHHNGQQA